MIHSNHGSVSYRFRCKRRFRSKIAKLSYIRVFNAPDEDEGVHLGILERRCGSKTRMTPVPEVEKFGDVCLRLDTNPQCGGQTINGLTYLLTYRHTLRQKW